MLRDLIDVIVPILRNVSFKDEDGSLKSLTILKETEHINQIAQCAQLLDHEAVASALKQNPMYSNLKRMADTTYRKVYFGEIAEMER